MVIIEHKEKNRKNKNTQNLREKCFYRLPFISPHLKKIDRENLKFCLNIPGLTWTQNKSLQEFSPGITTQMFY